MKGYKGFNSKFQCTPEDKVFQYEVGKEYDHDGEVSLCKSGFHFVENPLEVIQFYPPTGRFAEVEGDGDGDQSDGTTTKRVAKHLKINKELSLQELVELGVKFTLEKIDLKNAKEINSEVQSFAYNNRDWSAATNTGKRSVALNIGNKSVATNIGDGSMATNTGNKSVATNIGSRSVVTNIGNHSAAINVGEWSIANNKGFLSVAGNTGDRSIATNMGNQSVATNTGYWSAATNTGEQSTTVNIGFQSAATNTGIGGCSVSLGVGGKASGSVGNWLTLADWKLDEKGMWRRTDVRTVKVDGKKIKADTFYSLKNGKFVEVQN